MTEIIDGIIDKIVWDMMEKAVVAGPQLLTGGTVANIFDIGPTGAIEILSLAGQITTVVSGDACNLKLIMDPSTGSDPDMCLVVDISGFVLNSWIYLDGVIGNAAVNAVPGAALPLSMDVPLIVPSGTIDMSLSNSAPTTGAITWYMRYRPLKTGMTVTGKAAA